MQRIATCLMFVGDQYGRAEAAMRRTADREHRFTFTPAMSFVLDCDSDQQLDAAFAELSDGGTVLMPLQAYPFSTKFGWLQDRFGVSWQLNLATGGF
jgi:predicted 3-demethylubiquinone-9 3-methyltransferase (glyoxalase superfamily)